MFIIYSLYYIIFNKYKTFSVLIFSYINTSGNWENEKLCVFSLFVLMFLCLDQCTTTSHLQFKDFNDVLLLTVDDTEFNEAQKILKNVEIPSMKVIKTVALEKSVEIKLHS